MSPITFAICGCGSRGLDAYATYQKVRPDVMQIVAGADIRPERLVMLREKYGVPEEMCFASDEELLAQPRLADVMIIATQDRQHVGEALRALDLGYHLLLEKPISPDIAECVALAKKAHEKNRLVIVCHVLRYTRFYGALHTLLRRGEIGRIQTIDAMEHVAYWHFAHSYVRGNWRRLDESTPMIMAKCCHDMDLLRWLAGMPCERLSSFGSLSAYRVENAPEGAADRCVDCACRVDCPYDAEKIYLTGDSGLFKAGPGWPCNVLVNHPDEASVRRAIAEGPYGRCVYHCDNDVADHQTVQMLFEGGITATFTVSAFTRECHRTIHVTGTAGEILGDMDEEKLTVRPFGKPVYEIALSAEGSEFAGHGGGDFGLIENLCQLIRDGAQSGLTDLDASVESHVMAMAAEYSRLHGGESVDVKGFADSLQTLTTTV